MHVFPTVHTIFCHFLLLTLTDAEGQEIGPIEECASVTNSNGNCKITNVNATADETEKGLFYSFLLNLISDLVFPFNDVPLSWCDLIRIIYKELITNYI